MKESEKLELAAVNAKYESESIRLMVEARRARRAERFEALYLDQIKAMFHVEHENHRYTINGTPFGVIDYYPKSDKILIRKHNKWISKGIIWLIHNLNLYLYSGAKK